MQRVNKKSALVRIVRYLRNLDLLTFWLSIKLLLSDRYMENVITVFLQIAL